VFARALIALLAFTPLLAAAAEVPARLDWWQRVELGPLVSGVVREVGVAPGDAVEAGDLLVQLDDRGFEGRLQRTRAADRHARAALAEAEAEDARAAELYDRTLLSDVERNQARLGLLAARAAAAEARAALVDAQLALEYAGVRAPFAGVVLSVDASPGQSLVNELRSEPLVTLADNRSLRVVAVVDADQAARLSPGDTLRAGVRGKTLTAEVVHVGLEPLAEDSTDGPRYQLTARLDPPPGEILRAGEPATLAWDD
jgi:multidrug efflux system membrane fusion protein